MIYAPRLSKSPPMVGSTGRKKVNAWLCVVALMALQACTFGSFVVSHEFTAKAARFNANGTSIESEMTALPSLAHEQIGLNASRVTYEAPHSRWIVSTINDQVVFDVSNTDKAPIIVRLDEITIASNTAPIARPIVLAKESKHRRVSNPIDLTVEKPRPERIEPGARQGIYLDPDFSALFPNRTLFNAKRAFGSAAFIDAGVGNTLTLTVPIETSNGKEIVKFELRLTGSSARLINF
jgi:hypothetical protein